MTDATPPEEAQDVFTDPDEVFSEIDELKFGFENAGNGHQRSGGAENAVQVLDQWLPDGDEWPGKTDIVDREQSHARATIRKFPQFFPFLEDVGFDERFFQEYVELIDQYDTSVGGRARKDHVDVLSSNISESRREDDGDKTVIGSLVSRGDESSED
jgi:hypothetical protein